MRYRDFACRRTALLLWTSGRALFVYVSSKGPEREAPVLTPQHFAAYGELVVGLTVLSNLGVGLKC